MERRGIGKRRIGSIAGLFAAALGILQPGIDPLFLTLLSAATGLAPVHHGWIVGATQAGMAAGAVAMWLAGLRGTRLPMSPMIAPLAAPIAAIIALAASLATPAISDIAALIVVRALFGMGMGVVYTQAMSAAAARRPNGAYGATFLIQLILSTLVAVLLPALADTLGPHRTLGLLALAPLGALGALILMLRPEVDADAGPPQATTSANFTPANPTPANPTLASPALVDPTVADPTVVSPTPAAAWALAAATFCFIAATMMIWSFSGALAIAADIPQAMIGRAVAIGSVAGALTALAVMRERTAVPPALTGLLSGLGLLAPLALTRHGAPGLFILAIVLLNIGSTAIIIRCSGLATAASGHPSFRRFVACTHSVGMIAGPVAGSILSFAVGGTGLAGGAFVLLTGGCVALIFATTGRRRRRTAPLRPLEVAA